MKALRDPQTGCPWDVEQDFASIAPYTIEEAYEVADAIAQEDWDDLPSELGDLVLQVVFHAQIAQDRGLFDLATVLQRINAKMIARHPHVFATQNPGKTSEQQTIDWEKIKAAERAGKGQIPPGTLDGIAMALPALTRALKLQKRAARVGFDWPSTDQVMEKLLEETQELIEARRSLSADAMEDEFGDLLFVMVNLGRHLGLDAEAALRRTNRKFTNRFADVETSLNKLGKTPQDSTLEEMDALWDAAKHKGIF
ncbi:nucleoside triphosphate pyrophosphohydrolase [Thioclava sp. SK-1]|nr:nucleoside triphosphate pyrophosphohydrolase [Thioclava sp. SK-1]